MDNEMSKVRSNRIKFWIIGAIAIVLIAAITVGLLFFLMGNKKSSLTRTLELVQPQMFELMKMMDQGGTFRLSATLSDDILGDKIHADQNIDITADIKEQDLAGIKFVVGSKDNPLDLMLTKDGKVLTASSDQLFDCRSYSVTTTSEALRASVFNPENGGQYALPQELFDALAELAENIERSEDETAAEELREVFERLGNTLAENLHTSESKESITLLDGERKLKVIRLELDDDGFRALAKALKEEFEIHGLEEKLNNILSESYGEETSVSYDDLKDSLDEFLDTTDEKLNLTIEYAENAGCIVYCNAVFGCTYEDDGKTENIEFEWLTGAELEKDPFYRLKIAIPVYDDIAKIDIDSKKAGEGKTETALICSVPAADGSYTVIKITDIYELSENGSWSEAMTLSQGTQDASDEQADLTPLFELNAGGTLVREEDRTVWTLNKFSINAAAEGDEFTEIFALTKSSLSLEYDKHGKLDAPNGEIVDLMNADDKTIEDALAAVTAGFDKWIEKLSQQFESIKKQISLKEESRLTLDPSVQAIAYDNSRDRLYTAEYLLGSGTSLKVYSGADMALIAERKLPRQIVSMDADNGHLAYSFEESPYKLYVLDGETLEDFKSFSPWEFSPSEGDYLTNIYVDGDVVFCTSEDSHITYCIIDLLSDEEPKMSETSIGYHCVTAFDRANHTVALMDYGVSSTDICLLDLRNPNGRVETKVSSDFSNGQLYFNGAAFLANGKYYDAKGNKLKKGDIMPNIPYNGQRSSYEAVYIDEQVRILLETYDDGSLSTMLYTSEGVSSLAFAFEVATSYIGRYEDRIMLLVTDGIDQSIVCCSLVSGYTIAE